MKNQRRGCRVFRVDDWSTGGAPTPRADDLLAAVSQSGAVHLVEAHREYDADDLVARSQLFLDTRVATTHPAAIRL